MPNIKIKEYQQGSFATGKLRVVDDPRHNFLFPGEIVEVSEEWVREFDHLFKESKVEITIDEITRPLLYESDVEARLFDPRHAHKGESTIQAESDQIRFIIERNRMLRELAAAEIARAEQMASSREAAARASGDPIASHDEHQAREEQISFKSSQTARAKRKGRAAGL